VTTTAAAGRIWSGWDGVGTAAVTLVGPIAYFTRVCWQYIDTLQKFSWMKVSGLRKPMKTK